MPSGVYKRIYPVWNKGMKGIHLNPKHEFKKGHLMSLDVRRKIRETLINQREQRHNWKGGITPINYKIRNSMEYKDWRNIVYKMWNWTCGNCGIKCSNKDIVAHHIMGFSEYPVERFNINNGIVFCRACHLKTHRQTNEFIRNLSYGY